MIKDGGRRQGSEWREQTIKNKVERDAVRKGGR